MGRLIEIKQGSAGRTAHIAELIAHHLCAQT